MKTRSPSFKGFHNSDIYAAQRVAVLLDVQSLYKECKKAYSQDHRVQYEPLVDGIVGDRCLVRAIAYLQYRGDESETHRFQKSLFHKGIETKSKPMVDYQNMFLSWSVQMALDALLLKDKIDSVIFVTHDMNLADAFPVLEAHGVGVEVWGFESSLGHMLKAAAGKFYYLPEEVVDARPRRSFGENRESFYDGDEGEGVPTSDAPDRG